MRRLNPRSTLNGKNDDTAAAVREKGNNRPRYMTVFVIFLAFSALTLILVAEQRGLLSGEGDFTGSMLTAAELSSMDTDKPVSSEITCLFLLDSRQEESVSNAETMRQVLRDMRVPALEMDVSAQQIPDDLSGYRTVVAAMPDLDALGEDILRLCEYVEDGGRLLFSAPLVNTSAYNSVSARFGIISNGSDYKTVDGFACADGFMAGGDGRTYTVTAPYASAYNVGLDSQCVIYAQDPQNRTPLIWERAYGSGRFVLCNFGYTGKYYRGFYAAAYSLLEDVCVWPVINASSFYLDDFPSPTPDGDTSYILRDYEEDVATFYSDIWWPDILDIARTYGIRYTGMILETYSSQVSGALSRNQSVTSFRYYGNMLLNENGELGFHGYNHQPLVATDFVYHDGQDYKKWTSQDEMWASMTELYSFASAVFTDTTFNVYAPASNILSDEARAMIANGSLPGVRAIASTYQQGTDVYEQEFCVADDGITETPRVISGTLFDDNAYLAAFSELNFHYVNSHYMHPGDVLDKNQGADLGWEELKSGLTEYLDYLEEIAPGLTMTNGSEMAGRVQRFSSLCVDSVDETADGITLSFTGLEDEAWCLMRCRGGIPGEVTGGDLTSVTGNLYLLHVTSPQVSIRYAQ